MTHTNLTQRYDRAASNWGDAIAKIGYFAAYEKFVVAFLPEPQTCPKICDIGTGAGTMALAAINQCISTAQVTLVDPSQKMLDQAQRQIGTHVSSLALHNATLQDFRPSHKFDLVLCAHVIEHCPDPSVALAQLYQLVAPQGKLLLVVSRPHWCQWLIWLRWRHRWYSKSQIRHLAAKSGLPDPTPYEFGVGAPGRTSMGYVIFGPSKES